MRRKAKPQTVEEELPRDDDAAEAATAPEQDFLLQTLMDNVPDSIYFKDRQSRFTRINRYAAARFGVPTPAQAVGLTDFDVFTDEHAAQALRDEQEIIRTGRPLVNIEEKETQAGGEVRWVSTTKLPLRDPRGRIVGTFGISRDITERKKAEAQLERQAFYDPLTDLPNRALFLDRLNHLFQRGRRALGSPLFALLYLDLDRFKSVNDSLGHEAGDELLIAIARRLERCLRPGDTLARLGGDEFTVILDEIASEADATGVAERIHAELTAPVDVRGYEVFASVSVGIALSSAGYESPEEMLRDADTAMYRAKAAGRARHQVFGGDMHQRAISSLRIESDLRRALERREITPHYQPIVDLQTGAVVGFEALARWRHPTKGMIPPDLFIPVAEETGLIGAIGEWMLGESCRQLRAWQLKHPSRAALGISVNVSTRQLSQGSIVAEVERVLGATGLDPACLALEITESALMHNLGAGAGVIQRLSAMSVALHLDDFGTGYSSLAYLHSFPVHALKVDRSFVNRMESAPQHTAIVKAIVSLAHNLGMEVVAEGIETSAQAEALRALRCQRGQGYLFSKPLAAEDAERLLAGGPATAPSP
ncbi:MAG TPA: EAL domain-containing protein [Polyangia bacterium]|nr:EAL domain-containing protein [Polyangia bacterium]